MDGNGSPHYSADTLVKSPLFFEDAKVEKARAARQSLITALENLARGDKTAFEAVYAATSAKLYGVVVRILGRPDLADEVLQEVYIRVWQRAWEFDPASGSPITWLVTIARNRALDEVKRKTMRSLEECPEVMDIPSEGSQSDSYERDEELQRVLNCLDQLEPERRQIILLAYDYGMTREQIAEHIGRPIGTVKTLLRRSLAQLRESLEQ